MGTTYEVMEDVIFDERVHRKKCSVSFLMDDCHIICSCHFLEFRGILCRHAISILMRNGITSLPERYIWRRWRKDIRRAQTRVAVSYAGLVCTLEQLRHDNLVEEFITLADIATNDEDRTREPLDWIRVQSKEMSITKSITSSNLLSQQSNDTSSGNVQDPKCSKKEGRTKESPQEKPIGVAFEKNKGTFPFHCFVIYV